MGVACVAGLHTRSQSKAGPFGQQYGWQSPTCRGSYWYVAWEENQSFAKGLLALQQHGHARAGEHQNQA